MLFTGDACRSYTTGFNTCTGKAYLNLNTMNPKPTSQKVEELARRLHNWYLTATCKLDPESYNPKAQKNYDELTDEQRFIDRYIAEQILADTSLQESISQSAVEEYKKELGEKINGRQESRIPIHKSCPKAVKEKVLLKQDGYDLAIEEVKQIINE